MISYKWAAAFLFSTHNSEVGLVWCIRFWSVPVMIGFIPSDYVRTSCDMVFEPEIEFICDKGDSAVTFLENDTYIMLGEWANVGKKPSLEVRFTTVEPRGLLLFAGAEGDDYFALEVFDDKLYMVTDVGYGPVRKQVRCSALYEHILNYV